jgi:hypothetical protein
MEIGEHSLPLFQGRNTIGLPAPVAQWIEHQPSKLLVVSSNLARGADETSEYRHI